MSNPNFLQLLASTSVDGPALSNTTTATSILASSGKGKLGGGTLTAQSKLKITASGKISTLVTSPGTLTLDVRFGSIVVFNGGAMALNTTAQTNASWWLEAELTLRTIGNGTASNLLGTGWWKSRAVIGSAAAGSGGVGALMLPDTAPAVGSSFDITTDYLVDIFGTWSVANAANSITCTQSSIILCS